MGSLLVDQTCGPYHIEALIGHGAMGHVYKARHEQTDELVALKVVEIGKERESSILRLQREASALAAIRHPNIVELRGDPDADGDRVYFAMELLAGKSLEQILAKRRRLSVPEAVAITLGVLSGLDAANFHGMVHRDVKPSNVFVTFEGAVKILDFGLTHLVDSTRLTMAGTVLGTPSYMSPEQCEGKPVDGRSDVYSVGCVLYELLCGRPPFVGPNALTVIAQHVNAKAPPLPVPVPPELAKVLEHALERDVLRRLTSAAEFADVLGACPIAPAGRAQIAALVGTEEPTQRIEGLAAPETASRLAAPVPGSTARAPAADELEEIYWRGAVSLVKTIASCLSIWAVAMSVRPRVVTEAEIPSIYGPVVQSQGRLVSPARFEPLLTFSALAAIVVAFGVHALLRVYWRRTGLVKDPPPPSLKGSVWVLVFGGAAGALCAARFLLGDASSLAKYMLLATSLLLGVVMWFFVFMTALDGERIGRAFWREWKLWLGLLLGFGALAADFIHSVVVWFPGC